VSIIRIYFAIAGHFYSALCNLCVVTTAGKDKLSFFLPWYFFVSKVEDKMDLSSPSVTMTMEGLFCVDSVKSCASWNVVVLFFPLLNEGTDSLNFNGDLISAVFLEIYSFLRSVCVSSEEVLTKKVNVFCSAPMKQVFIC